MPSSPVTDSTALVPVRQALTRPTLGVVVPYRKKEEPPPDYPNYKWEPTYKAYDGTLGAYRFRMKPRHEKEIDINTGRKTILDARKVGEKRARHAANRADGIEQPKKTCPTLAAYWKTYHAAVVARLVDADSNLRAVTPFVKAYGHLPLNAISPIEHCEAYLTQRLTMPKPRGGKYKESTVKGEKQKISAVFQSAVEAGLLDRNPMKPTRKLKGKPRQDILPVEQQEAFLAALPDDLQRLVIVLAGSGLRNRELLGSRRRRKPLTGLRPRDVTRLAPHAIAVREELGKNSKARTVYIPAAIFQVLEAQREARGLTVRDPQAYWVRPASTIHLYFAKASVVAGLDRKLTLHDLRRTYGTRSAHDLKLDINTLKDQLGHASSATTATYYNAVKDAMRAKAVQHLDLGLPTCVPGLREEA